MRKNRLFVVLVSALSLQLSLLAAQVNSVNGVTNAQPAGYVPPLVSNGSLSMLVDQLGGQTQRFYFTMKPAIFRAGRRYHPPASKLIPFGHFDWGLSINDKTCKDPQRWTQSLDTRRAVVSCVNEYAEGLKVETTVFCPLNREMVVLKRRLTCTASQPVKVWQSFRYQLTANEKENRMPWRLTGSCSWDKDSKSVLHKYWADGYPYSAGVISLFSDKPVTAGVDGHRSDLRNSWTIEPGKPVEQCFYLLFEDLLDGKGFYERAAEEQEFVLKSGYDALLSEHVKAWADYWDDSSVSVPDANIQRMYDTAQYHLRANATRWSFPVGIFNTHWSGRFFGWDEMFCYQALVSSNHKEIAQRCPDFRKAILKKVLYRKAHYGKTGKFGAHYPWETLEDGAEGAPPYGFWADHVFHMSNIALSAWYQYLYTDDLDYLKNTSYPVIMECARFFLANMVYKNADGSMFIGKCTDLERLGTSRRNPFMTACGAIYTMESAAEAAALLNVDKQEAADWKHAASKLRESLPHKDGRYVPYAGCPEESVASLGGLFPYPLFDASNPLQKNAAYHFVTEGKASGNMYPVGKSLCAWYAGWMASALAMLDDRSEPVNLLKKAAEGAGCFGEMFEINEPAVSRTPWFATASGNVVYALNQVLLQSRRNEIHIAPAVPQTWKDYSFKLAAHGDLVVDVKVIGGQIEKLMLHPGNMGKSYERILIVQEGAIDTDMLDKRVVVKRSVKNGKIRLTLKFKGDTQIIIQGVSDNELAARLESAWKRLYEVYYSPKTHQFYNSPVGRGAPASIFKDGFLDPDTGKHGYGGGMEDCSIFGGLMLSLLVDQYEVTKDKNIAARALEAFKGLKLLATVHGVPGFVARGVCEEDGRSICMTSSRDQYTHFVHGLWRYYHSSLCSDATKAEINTLMHAVADRMIRNCTPENEYDFLRADGSRDPRGICRMWNVRPHEAARLPMIYAVAWDICRDKKYYEQYRKFIEPAVDQSISLATMPEKEINRWMPTYTLLQMQTSLEILYALEKDPALKKKIVKAMQPVAEMGAKRAIRVSGGEEKYLCASGEAALAQLMAEEFAFDERQKKLLAKSIMVSDPKKVGACRTIHLAAAYWRERAAGRR